MFKLPGSPALAKADVCRQKAMGRRVVVIGAGFSGLLVAKLLAAGKFSVTLIESQDVAGGHGAKFPVFYPDIDTKKIIEGLKSELVAQSVPIFTGVSVQEISGYASNYTITLTSDDSGKKIISCDSIVIASGFACDNDFALYNIDGQCDRVLFLSNFLMSAQGIPSSGPIVFWSNSESKPVCAAMLRSALQLKKGADQEVFILADNIKVAGNGLESMYQDARQAGAVVIKYVQPPQVRINGNKPVLTVVDPALDAELELEPGLLVLGDHVVPHPASAALARLARLHVDSEIFLQGDNSQRIPVQSNRKGIFLAGACRNDMDLEELTRDAHAVAAEVARLHQDGQLMAGERIAVIDTDLCKFCLTCFRSCPHQAIEMDHTAEVARVVEVLCEGCGTCVGECPAKAIKMIQETKS
jgi:heterodisulfide reductase subunit A